MITRTLRHTALWTVFALSSAASLWQGYRLLMLEHENSLINDLMHKQDVALNEVSRAKPALSFARAYYLKQQHHYDQALTTLGTIMDKGDPHFQARVRYNLGNIYLEQAMAEVEAMHMHAALPLVGLAKQAYRQALSLDSSFWDAKYNLEVAMRLLPEMDRLNLQDEEDQPSKTSQLWTTVPGFPRGLP